MKYLCTIIMLAGLFMGQAWGQDTETLVLPDGTNNFIFEDDIASDFRADLMPIVEDPMEIPISIWWPGGRESESFTLGEIRAILDRCREFLAPPPDYSTTLAIYRTRLGELEHQIELEKERLAKEERREQLRRDIDELLRRLE